MKMSTFEGADQNTAPLPLWAGTWYTRSRYVHLWTTGSYPVLGNEQYLVPGKSGWVLVLPGKRGYRVPLLRGKNFYFISIALRLLPTALKELF